MTGRSVYVHSMALLVTAGFTLLFLHSCADGSGSHTSPAGAICGNSVVDEEEDCDGSAMGDATCGTFGLYGGTLSCTSYCAYDTDGCGSDGRCGDGIVQEEYGEECDGTVLGETCQTLGFRKGTLSCGMNCRYNTSGCTSDGTCGDGITDSGEVCDGTCPGFGGFATISQCPSDCSGCTYVSTIMTQGVDRGGRISWSEESGTYAVQFTVGGICHLMLMDSQGTIMWAEPTGDSTCYLGDVLNDGDRIYVSGAILRDGAGITGFVACYDTQGQQMWWNDIPKRTTSVIKAIEKYGDSILVAGSSDGTEWGENLGERDMIVGILDPEGTWLERYQFGTPEDDNIKDMIVDDQGNIYLAAITKGNVCGEPQGDWDGVVFKASTQDATWCIQTGSDSEDKHLALTLDASGNLYVLGQTSGSLFSQSYGGGDVYVMAIGADDGSILWQQQYGTTYTDRSAGITSIGQDVYMTFAGGDPQNPGQSRDTGTDLFLLRLAHDDGSVAWSRELLTEDGDEYEAYVKVTNTGGDIRRFVISGSTMSTILPTDISGPKGAFLMVLDMLTY